MAKDARCECGCRIFFQRESIITTSSGGVFNIPSVAVVECVRCSRRGTLDLTNGARKSVTPFPTGVAGEKLLFLAALGDWKNQDDNSAPDFLTIEEADRIDFDRLGIPRPEVAQK